MSSDPAAAFRVVEGARQMLRQLQRGMQATEAADSSSTMEEDESSNLDEAEREDEADDAERQLADRLASSRHASSSSSNSTGSATSVPGWQRRPDVSDQTFVEAWTAQACKGELVGALVATAYPDRIGQAKPGSKGSYLLSTGQ